MENLMARAAALLPRRRFFAALALLTARWTRLMASETKPGDPEAIPFQDDGTFPNSKLPLLLYRAAIDPATEDLASAFERCLADNNWTGSWRNGVYPFHHYHSTSHEVLAIYRGEATIRLGGPKLGASVKVKAGDVIVIPAGVAHQKIKASGDFGVVGAYPGGRRWDLLRGEAGDRPQADRNIAAVPLPELDPLQGDDGPLLRIWKEAASTKKNQKTS